MKGVTVELAKESNLIDVYALVKKAAKEGCYSEMPTDEELKKHYIQIYNKLRMPGHFIFLAKRSRGYVGFLHAYMVPGRWDGTIDTIMVDMIYVVEKRRKNGIGLKLVKAIKELASKHKLKIGYCVDADKHKDIVNKYKGKEKLKIYEVE
jgi:GNAT superfamily N-acetyltransferase